MLCITPQDEVSGSMEPFDRAPLYLSFANRREAGEVEEASQPESPQGG